MMWLAAAPLAEVLLSRMPTTYTLGTHYAGAWLGYVLVAFAFALRDLDARRARTAVFWCIGLCVVELAAANPMHPGLNLHAVAARDRALDAYLAKLPANADVATQEEAYTHLALDDPRATVLPETSDVVPSSCYLLLDRDYPNSARLEEYGAAVDDLVKNGSVRARRSVGRHRTLSKNRRRLSLIYSSCASASVARAGQSPSAFTMRLGAAHGDHRAT